MCALDRQAAKISRVVFGAWNEKVGASGPLYDLVRDKRLGSEIELIPEVFALESISMLKEFFETKRSALLRFGCVVWGRNVLCS
jgi:tRNA(adenine34) deaminase